MKIHPIPAFNDNYIWALYYDQGDVLIVDPGDANPVIDFITTHELTLRGILITHHHMDHIGGIDQLVQTYGNVPVYGPEMNDIPHCTVALKGGEVMAKDGPLGLHMKVLAVPGHTLGHLAYIIEDDRYDLPPLLFCGDTLFSCGCGRLFEGTPEMMWNSLQSFMGLPENTFVCAAHEYTLSNVEFCLAVKPGDEALEDYHRDVVDYRQRGIATLPTTISHEMGANLFLRVEDPEVQQAIATFTGKPINNALDAFAALREAKDNF